MADIFISYTREDRAWVEALVTAFESLGWTVWWDARLSAGESFDEVIEQQIEQAKCLIVLWSASSVKSRWVKSEAEEGLDRKILFPVFIEEVRPPMGFRRIHTVSLIGWEYTTKESAFQRLVRDVEKRLGPSKGRAAGVTASEKAASQKKRTEGEKLEATYTDVWGIEYVLIQPGTFIMGSESGRDNEKPVHEVTITKPYYMGKYPVTQEEYYKVIGSKPSKFQNNDRHPVEQVSWEDTQSFIRKVNTKAPGCRLPTEAEWEYACRAGSKMQYSFGDDEGKLDEYAWYGEDWSKGSTHPVGQKRANPWGLYDMHGNVWEWVSDWYGDYSSSAQVDPTGPESGSRRVVRGGGWYSPARYLRSAYRGSLPPEFRYYDLGFRVVRTAP